MMRLVYIIAGNEEEADKITDHLLEQRLVACVNSFPVKSKYWWEGKLETDNEVAMIAKTRAELTEKVIEEVKKLHSYDVPAIDVLEVESCNKDMIPWVEEETRQE